MRNAWQWIAMASMLIDHLGYWDGIPVMRAIGRLAMPMYCILFVMTLQKNQIHGIRLLILAIVSQVPFTFFFEEVQLNIIVGFYIFYRLTVGVTQRDWAITFSSAAIMWMTSGLPGTIIPVSYGWYLYATLAVFFWCKSKPEKQFLFGIVTGAYVFMTRSPRQLIAVAVPFITRIRMPRPNKYLYRYFYPGHLFILAAAKMIIAGSLMGNFYGFWGALQPYEPQPGDEYYDESGYYYDEYQMYLFEKAVQDANDTETVKEEP